MGRDVSECSGRRVLWTSGWRREGSTHKEEEGKRKTCLRQGTREGEAGR